MQPSRAIVVEGETAILRCVISGEEPMEIKWTKLGGGTMPRTAMVRKNSLEIRKATIKERGRYRCTAKNKYGQASTVGSIFVNEGVYSQNIYFFYTTKLSLKYFMCQMVVEHVN